jgi:hypothetical protein
MAYTQPFMVGSIAPSSAAVLTPEDLSAANAVYGSYVVAKQCKIKRIAFYVTTLINASTNPAVTFTRRPTFGSTSGAILLGTVTIPTGSAVGTVIYKNIAPVNLYPGDELSLAQTVQASTAGQGFYMFEIDDDPEVPANQSKMLASI